MKGFGIALLWIGALMLIGGLFIVGTATSDSGYSSSQADTRIRYSQMALDACEAAKTAAMRGGFEYRECDYDRIQHEKMIADMSDDTMKSAQGQFLGLSLAAGSSFFFLLGAILYAAGKLEQIILAGRAQTDPTPQA